MKNLCWPPAGAWPLIILLMAVSGALTYFVGVYVLGTSVEELKVLNARQYEEAKELMRRNEALMAERTIAERRMKVSNQTLDYLRDMLQSSEAELRKTGEELELFRKITGPNREEKLSIHTLSIFMVGENGRWGYRLVVYHGDISKIAKGRYDLVLHGHVEGSPGRHRLSDLGRNEEDLSFSFRHFATLSGEFQLPEGFEVERVEVKVSPSGRGQGVVNESFSWRGTVADPD